MGEFRMPSLGADMEAGTLVSWRIKPGDAVKRGDIVADVETQKGVIEVEIFQDGVVETLVVQEGQKVPVGEVLALVRGPGEAAAPPTPPSPAPAPLRSSPAARQRAAALGVELSSVRGTGPGGAVTLKDVEDAAAAKGAPGPGPSPMRAAIAAAMARSKKEIPHYYVSARVDVTRSLAWMQEQNQALPVAERLLHSVVVLKAVAVALKEAPALNGHFVDGAFRPADAAHIGVAISLRGGGLVAPALHDVGKKPLPVLMRELTDLVSRARTGSLRSSEMTDATITLTHLAEPGVETLFGVIYPPQVALVGVGLPVPTPVVVDGQVVIRTLSCATVAADHRASDGHQAGRFLSALDQALQHPEAL